MRKKSCQAVHPRYRELVRGLEAYLARKEAPERWLGITVATDPRLLPNLRRGQRYPNHIMQELAARAGLPDEQAGALLLCNVAKGDQVAFLFGRGKSRRELRGEVQGQGDRSNGRWVAVLVVECERWHVRRVRVADITANLSRTAQEPAALPLAA